MVSVCYFIVRYVLLVYEEYRMAGMNLSRAFNSKMITKLIRYKIEEGSFDENNDWVEGVTTKDKIMGVILSGNKFSQFEVGQAKITEDGGIRISDYKALHIKDKYNLKIGDKILYNKTYYNVLQRSDEIEFNYRSFLLEKSEGWKP